MLRPIACRGSTAQTNLNLGSFAIGVVAMEVEDKIISVSGTSERSAGGRNWIESLNTSLRGDGSEGERLTGHIAAGS